MNTHILIGIDANVSHQTQKTLRYAADPFGASARFTLCSVIPVPFNAMPTLMKAQGFELVRPQVATCKQIESAQETLERAQRVLLQHDPNLTRSNLMCVHPMGEVSVELARVVETYNLDCLMLGSRGRSVLQRLRRVFASSISRECAQSTRCPVILVDSSGAYVLNLDIWYKKAIMSYLFEQEGALVTLTSEKVIHQFTLPRNVFSLERMNKAAEQALTQLSVAGKLLLYRDSHGQLCYVND